MFVLGEAEPRHEVCHEQACTVEDFMSSHAVSWWTCKLYLKDCVLYLNDLRIPRRRWWLLSLAKDAWASKVASSRSNHNDQHIQTMNERGLSHPVLCDKVRPMLTSFL